MKALKLIIITLLTISLISSCVPKEIQPPKKEAKVALVLGAGASRGFAHIGVIKVLESNKIPIHMVVGTSVGSLIGSLYAYGFNGFELQKLAFDIKKEDIVDLTLPGNGFIKGEKLEKYVNWLVRDTPIEKLKLPFYAVATDIQTGKEVVFNTGNTGSAVRASCSIPGIFVPPVFHGKMYVDGGVVSPVAVDAARRFGADIVIAVDISSDTSNTKPANAIETILQSISIMYSKLSYIQLQKADVIIRPKVGHIGSADFSKRHEAILEGEKATLEALPKILETINKYKVAGLF